MQQVDYLEWVMLETLRMHPPGATMHKVCTKKYIMRKGFRDQYGHDMSIYVREGTPILIPVLAIHMDPKYYPEPQRFDPERFSPERKTVHSGTIFLPFGEGPRMCMGMRFAQAQVKLAVAKLILNYRITVGPTDKPGSVVEEIGAPVAKREEPWFESHSGHSLVSRTDYSVAEYIQVTEARNGRPRPFAVVEP
uniref:Cytochrome P450 n=1 Tax=Anopheles culicifacies TaxID=139723 RepID=A0A182LTV0_9DIPT